MIGEPGRLRALDQFLQSSQVLAVGLLRRTEIHGHAVLHYFVLLQDLIEDVQRPAAIDHEILGNNLEPVAHGLARQNVVVVRRAQANPYAVFGKSVKAIRRHSDRLRLREKKEGQRCPPAPQQVRSVGLRLWLRGLLLFFRHLAAVGCAAALALARVLFLHLLVSLLLWFLSGSGSLRPGEQIGSLDAGAGAREQARDRRTRE